MPATGDVGECGLCHRVCGQCCSLLPVGGVIEAFLNHAAVFQVSHTSITPTVAKISRDHRSDRVPLEMGAPVAGRGLTGARALRARWSNARSGMSTDVCIDTPAAVMLCGRSAVPMP